MALDWKVLAMFLARLCPSRGVVHGPSKKACRMLEEIAATRYCRLIAAPSEALPLCHKLWLRPWCPRCIDRGDNGTAK